MRNSQSERGPASPGGAALSATLAVAFALGPCFWAGTAAAQAETPLGTVTDTIKGWFSPSAPGAASSASDAGASPDQPACPSVDVRQGTSTMTTYGGPDQVATNVRYQASVGELARECSFSGGSMTMKIGVQGRVILGPMATPGQLDLPLRIALVQEGPEPRTLWTKLYRVPVTISPGAPNVPFVQVEQDLSVPKPKAEDAEGLVVYVGFDQMNASEEKPKKAKAKGKHAGKP